MLSLAGRRLVVAHCDLLLERILVYGARSKGERNSLDVLLDFYFEKRK